MAEPDDLVITIRGGSHDGETFTLPADQAGVGDTVPYLDAHYRLMELPGQGWVARVVRTDVDG